MLLPVLFIILAGLILLSLIPVGLEGGFAERAYLSARIGPLAFILLPRSEKPESPEDKAARLARKARKKTERRLKKEAKREKKKKQAEKEQSQLKTILDLSKMGLRALKRFRRRITVDYILLHWTAAAKDPYDAAVQYGAVCTALGVLPPLAERSLKIRERDFEVLVRFDISEPEIEMKIILTLHIWEIIWMGMAFGREYICWKHRHRRKKSVTERKDGNGE